DRERGVVAERLHRLPEQDHRVRVERVVRPGPVEPDEQHVAVRLGGDRGPARGLVPPGVGCRAHPTTPSLASRAYSGSETPSSSVQTSWVSAPSSGAGERRWPGVLESRYGMPE